MDFTETVLQCTLDSGLTWFAIWPRSVTVFDTVIISTQGGLYDKLSDYQLLKKTSVRHIVVTIITIFHITHTVNTFGLQYVKQSEEQTMSGKIQYKIIKRCFWRQGKGTWLRYFNLHFKNRWRSSKVVRVQELVTICLALPSPNAVLFHPTVSSRSSLECVEHCSSTQYNSLFFLISTSHETCTIYELSVNMQFMYVDLNLS